MCNNNRDGRVPSVFLAAATGVPSKGKGVTHTRIPILMGGGWGEVGFVGWWNAWISLYGRQQLGGGSFVGSSLWISPRIRFWPPLLCIYPVGIDEEDEQSKYLEPSH